jgi:hypothetical protein
MNTPRTAGADAMRGEPALGAHPSPYEGRVGGWATWFGILGGPIAWSAQQLVNAPLLAHACYPKDVPLGTPIWANASSVALAVEGVAITVCIVAALTAWRNWSHTRNEKEGSGFDLIGSGDGRSRFMSMVGMICSGLFLFATIFATGFLFAVSACQG